MRDALKEYPAMFTSTTLNSMSPPIAGYQQATAGHPRSTPRLRRFVFAAAILLIGSVALNLPRVSTWADEPLDRDGQRGLAPNVERLLERLPEDTERVEVSQEPFRIQSLAEGNYENVMRRAPTAAYCVLANRIGLLSDLADETIVVAIASDRCSRTPADENASPLNRCELLQFDETAKDAVQTAFEACVQKAARVDEIGGKKVGIFKERVTIVRPEWRGEMTFLLANPEPSVLLCSTDRTICRRALRRFVGSRPGRALPSSLPEWEHVNFEAPVWGLAHCRGVESAKAPAEFDGQRKNSGPGSQEIFGYVYLYDPKGANEITARFLAKSSDAVEAMKARWQRRLKEIRANIDEVAPGVVEISLPRGWPTSRESIWNVVWPCAGDDGP